MPPQKPIVGLRMATAKRLPQTLSPRGCHFLRFNSAPPALIVASEKFRVDYEAVPAGVRAVEFRDCEFCSGPKYLFFSTAKYTPSDHTKQFLDLTTSVAHDNMRRSPG